MRPWRDRLTNPMLSQGLQELFVGLGLLELREQGLHRLERLAVGHLPAEPPDLLELGLGKQQFLPAGAGADEVERREDPAVGELALQVELHVARALELLEDDVVHPRAGLDELRSADGQRAALLHGAGGAEKAAGTLERGGVDAARHGPSAL